MEEFFYNKFVIRMEFGDPGTTTYTICSTRAEIVAMVAALSSALTDPDAEKVRPVYPRHFLWNEYVTVAFGETRNISLAFEVVEDLGPFHVRPTFLSRLRHRLKTAAWVALFAFAAVGARATWTGYVWVSEFAQVVLFGIPMLAFVVWILSIRDRARARRLYRK